MSDTTHIDKKIYDNSGNPEVLRVVPRDAMVVLDVGCGAGGNARILAQQGKVVDGITLSEHEANAVASFMHQVWIHNLENGLPTAIGSNAYDCVICSHVLEHIVYPEKLLSDIRTCVRANGCVVVALPNLLYHWNRFDLLRGRFEYSTEGLMDNTHVRWYTFDSAQRLLSRNGFSVQNAFVEGRFPMPMLRRYFPRKVLFNLDQWAGHAFPGLCGYQMIFVCRKV